MNKPRRLANDPVGKTMNVSDSNTAQQPENAPVIPGPGQRHSWAEVIASLIFSAATYEMLVLYGIVHWDIMFRWKPESPEPPQAVFTVLDHLCLLRFLFATLALVWAVWAFRRAPRWIAWVALGLAILALCSNAIIT